MNAQTAINISDHQQAHTQRAGRGRAHESLSSSITYHLTKYFDAHNNTLPESGLYKTIIHEAEKAAIKATLEFCDNNQSKSAYILGINRNTLRKKMEQFNLM